MGFVDLFRPKWKHSDATVRAAAVRSLGSEELDTLEQVARNDRDADIRRIAVKKINDVEILLDLSSADPDESVRDLARQRGSTLILGDATAADDDHAVAAVQRIVDVDALATVAKTGESDAARRKALDRIDDAKVLADVARNGANQQLQLEALARIDDQATLRAIAMADPERVIALAALDRVADEDALAEIARKGKNKAVRKRAKSRAHAPAATADAAVAAVVVPNRQARARPKHKPRQLSNEQRASQAREKKVRGQQLALCRQLEAIVDDPDLLSRVTVLEEKRTAMRVLEVDDGADPELTTRFGKAMAAADKRISQLHDAARDAVEAQAEVEAAATRWVAHVDEIAELSAEEATPARLEALRQAFADQGQLGDDTRQADLERQLERALRDAEKRHREKDRARNDAERAVQIVERAEEIAGSARVERAGEKLAGLARDLERLGAAVDEAVSARLEGARKTLKAREAEAQARQAEHEQQNEHRVQSVLAKLEKTLAGTDMRETDRLLKDVTQTAKRMGPLPSRERAEELRVALEAAKSALYDRLHELREQEDWKRWSNVPKREALCVSAEKLLAQEDLGEVAKALRDLQAQWKTVGPVPREKADALWERFKAACDKAREKCAGFFAEREAERDANLKAKETLCEQAEALATSTEWTETAEKLKTLQTEWKNSGPVARKESDAIWKRFRAACDAFFNARKEHLEERDDKRIDSLEKKTALCEQAEALSQTTTWEQTAGKLKSLQAQWKRLGPVPRSQSDAIWKRFRTACDTFFDARQAELDRELDDNLAAKEAICAELEALAADTAGDVDHAKTVLEARQRFNTTGPAPSDDEDELWERFVKASEAVVLAHPEAFADTEFDPVANLKKLDGAIRRAEKIIATLASKDSAPAISADEDAAALAEKLRAAMASNTFAEKPEDPAVVRQRAVDDLKELAGRVARLGPMQPDDAAPLHARFEALTREFLPRERKRKPRRRKGKKEGASVELALAPAAENAVAAPAPAAPAPAVVAAPAPAVVAAPAPAAPAPAVVAAPAPAVVASAVQADSDPFAEDVDEVPAVAAPLAKVASMEPPSRRLSISERLKALNSKLPGKPDEEDND